MLETETYSKLIKKSSREKGNIEETQELWNTIPEHIHSVKGVANILLCRDDSRASR